MPKYTAYIPDHIRLQRTDRLWHTRESMLLVIKRLLPRFWLDQTASETIIKLRRECDTINSELMRRKQTAHTRQLIKSGKEERFLEVR